MANENEFVITRVFNVPRELMFKVWTSAEHLEKWWGPVYHFRSAAPPRSARRG